MANSIAKLAILLTTDASGVGKGFAQAKQQTAAFDRSINGLTMSVGKFAVGFITLQQTTRAIQWMSELAAESERVRVQLEGIAGGAEKAKEVLADMQGRPLFDLKDQNAAARTLLSTGTQVDQLKTKMDSLADVAAGSGNNMEHLADMLAKVKTDGKLAEGELTMFAKAGIPLQRQLSEQMGITEDKVKELANQGKITGDEVEKAFDLMTKAGGAFHDANAKMLRTTTGEWKQLKDVVETSARGIGNKFNIGLSNLMRGTRQGLGVLGIGDDPFKKLQEEQAKTVRTTNNLGQAIVSFKSVVAGGRVTIIEPKQVQTLDELSDKFEEMRSKLESMHTRGAVLTQSLRTPSELFADSVREAVELLRVGAISGQTYQRAMNKAKGDLQAQLDSARKIHELQREPSVAAASRFTSSGLSQVFQAALEMRRMEQEQKETTAAQKEGNRIAQLQLDELKKEKPQVTIKAVGHL